MKKEDLFPVSVNQDIIENEQFFIDIKQIIDQSRYRVYTLINAEITNMYWSIGKYIRLNLMSDASFNYGKKILQTLSAKLIEHYGKGFGVRNLANMVKFYEFFPNYEIVQSLSTRLSWSHFVELLNIKYDLQREFYYTLSISEGWSVRQLRERINSMLYERTALSKKPAQTIKSDIEKLRTKGEMSEEIVFRDPYILDFLELRDTYSEKDLEQSIIYHLQHFILEIGNDFAFLARQKRITIDNTDYYIDLLFFHRKLNRLMAVELKLGQFEHNHKSQMELYLRWLDRYEKQTNENTPLGIILCATKSDELVELLELDATGIHVAEYLTCLPSKSLLKTKLYEAIELSQSTITKDKT